MIISSAPTRLSLFGGGTDVPPFCWEQGGMTINLAIDKRTVVTIDNGKLSFTHGGGAGLGGSGSLLVALLGALKKYGGLEIDKSEIAWEAFEIEFNQWKYYGGWQDQVAASFGGFNFITSNDKKKIIIKRFPQELVNDFIPWLVLFDTGIRRESGKIQHGFIKPSKEQLRALNGLKKVARIAEYMLFNKRYRELGDLLDITWELKKKSNDVTNETIDAIYDRGKELGAFGGKIMGAGKGGHFLFIVRPIEREYFIKQMENYGIKHIPFLPDNKGLEVRCVV